jgi:hypothetical protein
VIINEWNEMKADIYKRVNIILRHTSRARIFLTWALGNVFNLADANDTVIDDLGPIMGKVFLYFCNDDPEGLDLALIKPSSTIKCSVSPTVGPVLKAVAGKFSLVRGKCTIE